MHDIAIVTCAAPPLPDQDQPFLVEALEARGLKVAVVPWDAPEMDWASVRLAVVRSTWDYHHRRDAFVAWADQAGARTALWNPRAVLRWNTHKGYLRELEARGVPSVPTVWAQHRGARLDLAETMRARGWTEAVVKPAVSGGAFETIRVGLEQLAKAQAHLDAVQARTDVMVQPYLHGVEGHGERSLVYLNGAFSHSVRRRPALAGQEDFLTEVDLVTAADGERAFAEQVLAALPPGVEWLYARVDIAPDVDGTLRLMELELVEPSLFLRLFPSAADVLADAIVARVR